MRVCAAEMCSIGQSAQAPLQRFKLISLFFGQGRKLVQKSWNRVRAFLLGCQIMRMLTLLYFVPNTCEEHQSARTTQWLSHICIDQATTLNVNALRLTAWNTNGFKYRCQRWIRKIILPSFHVFFSIARKTLCNSLHQIQGLHLTHPFINAETVYESVHPDAPSGSTWVYLTCKKYASRSSHLRRGEYWR